MVDALIITRGDKGSEIYAKRRVYSNSNGKTECDYLILPAVAMRIVPVYCIRLDE
jgi:hypothetical protein